MSASPGRNQDDEVDLLIDAWSDRLPGVDLSPLDVMSRLRRAAARLGRIRTAAFRAAGLASWQFDVLAALRREPAPHELSPIQLAQSTMTTSATITHRLDSLVADGLAERNPNPRDGRSVLIRPTDAGIERVDAAMTELARREAIALEALDPNDQARLAALLRLLGDSNV